MKHEKRIKLKQNGHSLFTWRGILNRRTFALSPEGSEKLVLWVPRKQPLRQGESQIAKALG